MTFRNIQALPLVLIVAGSSAMACSDASDEPVDASEEMLRRRHVKDAGSDTGTSTDAGSHTGTPNDAGSDTGATNDAGSTPPPVDAGSAPPPDAGGGCGPVQLGAGASLGGTRLFPDDNAWNRDVSSDPVDPNNAAILTRMGTTTPLHPDFGAPYNGAPNGIPYVVVGPTQPRVPIVFTAYGDESDPGPYPVPANAPIEAGGDRHVLVVQCSSTTVNHLGTLFELFSAYPQTNGSWNADSGAIFDANSNALRPAGWTSTDAAGLPVFAGLVRYDEVVEQKEIRHALRFTASVTRNAYVSPARHAASSHPDTDLPPMGMRMRLKSTFDVSTFPASTQVILNALKRYGMFLADNGSSGYISGAPDNRWNDSDLGTLRGVKLSDFEIVKMGTIVTQ